MYCKIPQDLRLHGTEGLFIVIPDLFFLNVAGPYPMLWMGCADAGGCGMQPAVVEVEGEGAVIVARRAKL